MKANYLYTIEEYKEYATSHLSSCPTEWQIEIGYEMYLCLFYGDMDGFFRAHMKMVYNTELCNLGRMN